MLLKKSDNPKMEILMLPWVASGIYQMITVFEIMIFYQSPDLGIDGKSTNFSNRLLYQTHVLTIG